MGEPYRLRAMQARAEELLSDVGRMRSQLTDVQARSREVRGTARSADGGITVTVGPRGALLGLRIEPRTYRRSGPDELAGQIVELAGEAVRDAAGKLEEILAPFLPRGVALADVLAGTADLTTRGAEPVTVDNFDEWRAGFGRPAERD
jgi:DNA-binding protein YbaB